MSERIPLRPGRPVLDVSKAPGRARRPTVPAPDAATPECIPTRVRGRRPMPVSPLVELNVLVVGQSGSGKSTFIEAMTGQRVPNITPGLQDGTTDTSCYTIHYEFNDTKYVIHFWDTPGLTGQLAKQHGSPLDLLFKALDVLQARGVHELDAIFLFFVKSARLESVSTWDTIKEFLSRMFVQDIDINLNLIATHCAKEDDAEKLFMELERSVIGRVLKRLTKGRRHFHDIPEVSGLTGSSGRAQLLAEARRMACEEEREKYLKIVCTSTAKSIPAAEMRKNLRKHCGYGTYASQAPTFYYTQPAMLQAPSSYVSSSSTSSTTVSSSSYSSEESSCFARTATVQLADGTTKHMGHLQLGDRVLTATGAYMPVCAWLHRAATATASFVVISATSTTSGSNSLRRMSGSRLLSVLEEE